MFGRSRRGTGVPVLQPTVEVGPQIKEAVAEFSKPRSYAASSPEVQRLFRDDAHVRGRFGRREEVCAREGGSGFSRGGHGVVPTGDSWRGVMERAATVLLNLSS